MTRVTLYVFVLLCAGYVTIGKCDEDCPSGSLDDLNLTSLLKESIKGPTCLTEARSVVTRKYENATFIVKGPFMNEESGINESEPFLVEMRHYETIRSIVKTFGDLIRSLSVAFSYMDESMSGEIVGDINENCTKSLLQVEFNNCYGTVLNKLNNSYPNVYIVFFSTYKYQELKNVSLKLSEIFPQLKRLQLDISNVDYWKLVGDRFPHLTSLNVNLPTESARPNVGTLFQNSPNINSLHITYTSLHILKAASKFLPNLSELVVEGFSNDLYNGSKIHFNNVNFLSLYSNRDSASIPQKLVFYQIQYIDLTINYDFTNDWITFFTNQQGKTLEFFHMTADSFTGEHLAAIADSQPNIKYAMITSRTKTPVDAIINFAEKSSKLFQCQFSGRMNDIAERDQLEEQLEINWNVDFYYMDLNSIVITLTRLK